MKPKLADSPSAPTEPTEPAAREPRRLSVMNVFLRTALVGAPALLLGCLVPCFLVLTGTSVAGLFLLSTGAIWLVALGAWLTSLFVVGVPALIAVLCLRRPMSKSKRRARNAMAVIALVISAIVTAVIVIVPVMTQLVLFLMPSMLLVSAICIAAAPWMVGAPRR